MTLNDVAERIGVSKRTIMRWVDFRQRRFPQPSVRIGRVIEFNPRLIEQWCKLRRSNAHDKSNRADRPRMGNAAKRTSRQRQVHLR